MTNRNIPHIELDEIMNNIRREIADKKNREPISSSSVEVKIPDQLKIEIEFEKFNYQSDFEFNKDGLYQLNDFLRLDNETFILKAYQALLKRDPDELGFKEWYSKLSNGQLGKVDVLLKIRYSAEYKEIFSTADIRDLPSRRQYLTIFRKIPLIGKLIDIFLFLNNLPQLIKELIAKENILENKLSKFNRHYNDFLAALENRLERNTTDIELAHKQHSQYSKELDDKLDLQFEKYESINDRLIKELIAKENILENKLSEFNRHYSDFLAALENRLERITTDIELAHEQHSQYSKELDGKLDLQFEKYESINDRLYSIETSVASTGKVFELERQIKDISSRNFNSENFKELEQEIRRIETSKMDVSKVIDLEEQIKVFLSSTADLSQVVELTNKVNIDSCIIGELKKQLDDINNEIKLLSQKRYEHKISINDQERRIGYLLAEVRKRLPKEINTDQINNILKEEKHLCDVSYLSFENQFRGTQEDIKNRLSVYLPYIEQASSKQNKFIVADLGCGRGEWLELLAENSYAAVGVDNNNAMAALCHDKASEIVISDAIDYLKKQKTKSISVITCLHFIEHITHQARIELLDETLRVLQPGGVVIIETPYAGNVLVGSYSFYCDPNHIHPVHDEALKYIAEERGFINLDILQLNPCDESFLLQGTSEIISRFNKYFYGPQDFALIGYKA
jgi:SAM-dependent methyltransferase